MGPSKNGILAWLKTMGLVVSALGGTDYGLDRFETAHFTLAPSKLYTLPPASLVGQHPKLVPYLILHSSLVEVEANTRPR